MTLISIVHCLEKTIGEGWMVDSFSLMGAIGVAGSKGLLSLGSVIKKYEQQSEVSSWQRKALNISKYAAWIFAALIATAAMGVLALSIPGQLFTITMMAPGLLPIIVKVLTIASGVCGFFAGAMVVNDAVIEIKEGLGFNRPVTV